MEEFTPEEIKIAKSVDLVELAQHEGFTVKKKGAHYQLAEMDSVMIFNRESWYRYSQSVGGSAVDFLQYFRNLTFKEAVEELLSYAGYVRIGEEQTQTHNRKLLEQAEKKQQKKGKEEKKGPFILPQKSESNRRIYGYLLKTRKLSKQVVRFWVDKGLLYESEPYHNAVFVGKDPEGVPKFASQRGTIEGYGKPFKGDVSGNDKTYGVNIMNLECSELNVYEASIDAMSDMDFREDYRTSILALGMVSDGPLEKLLTDYPHIQSIHLCLDNDLPGREAAKKLARKYVLEKKEVYVRLPPFGKDYNAFLQYERENRELQRQVERIRRKKERKEKDRAIIP